MVALTLTILGCGPATPNPGGACSGYLLRQGESAVLMDCGSGVVGRIPQHVPTNRLQGVVLSHLHPDHYFDLVPLYYALKFGEPRPAELGPRLPVYVPPGGRTFLSTLVGLIAPGSTMFDDMFDIREYAAHTRTVIGGLQFTFIPVQHYVLSHALRVQASDGATLVFSSDVAPCAALVEAARDADLFLCESALLDLTQDQSDPVLRGHMTAAEAGEAARAAGARRLVITHYRSGEANDAHHLATATRRFAGPVELARDGKTFVVGQVDSVGYSLS